MKCSKCGAEIAEGAKFCVTCGAAVEGTAQEAPQAIQTPATPAMDVSAAAEKAQAALQGMQKLPVDTVALIVGTLLILVGLILRFGCGVSISETSFGGDYQTYTYRGIVALSQQLAHLNKAVAWLVMGLGAFIDLWSLRKSK